LIDALARDMRYAARTLSKNPGFSLVSVLTLALALGATASIFTVVYRVLLNPLPYEHSDRLIDVSCAMPSRNIPSIGLTSRHYYNTLIAPSPFESRHSSNAEQTLTVMIRRSESASLSPHPHSHQCCA